jgi:hypothetical protein
MWQARKPGIEETEGEGMPVMYGMEYKVLSDAKRR